MSTHTTRRRSATRARLLEGALEVLAERGYGAASVEDICAAAGFTRGAFYSNFATKDELVLALFEATTDRLLDRIAELLPTVGDEPQSLLDAVLGLLDTEPDQRRWHLISAEFTLHALRNPAAATALAAQRTTFRRRLTELVESIVAASGTELTVDPELFVRLVIALHEGARTQTLLEPDELAAGTLERAFLPTVLDAVTR
jgi:AcrR family transcriptional regulator